MLSVFGFCFFFGVLPLRFLGFLSFYFCQVPGFWKIIGNLIFPFYWLANGNLGYRNLLVIQGEMLPFFFRFFLQISYIILLYIGDGLSWNEFRDNTATTHKRHLFCC